jgi:mannose-1-phosphate guanylyltransferase
VKGFILAAGYGERLRPITESMPKSMVPVLNLPSIVYAVFLLKEAGITHIVCNLHYKDRQIIDFFEAHDFFGLSVHFSMEEEILGTGGGLKKCEPLLGDETFVLINSDIVLDIHLGDVLEHHRRSSHPATLVLYQTERAERIGPVGVLEGRVVGFHNRGDSVEDAPLIYTGIAVLSPGIFPYLKRDFSSVVDTGYEGLIRHHSVGYTRYRGFWLDIGTLETFWQANVRHMSRVISLGNRFQDSLGMRPHTLSPLAKIDSTGTVKDSVVGAGARIGARAVVEHAVVFPGSTVQEDAVIRNAVVHPNGIIDISEE